MRNTFAAASLAVYVTGQDIFDDEVLKASRDLEDILSMEMRELEDTTIMEEGRELSHYYYYNTS